MVQRFRVQAYKSRGSLRFEILLNVEAASLPHSFVESKRLEAASTLLAQNLIAPHIPYISCLIARATFEP